MKRMEKFRRSLKERWQHFVEVVVHRPIHAFKAFCYGVGLTVVLSTSAFLLIVFFFFMSLPSIDEMDYIDLKRIAGEKVYSLLDEKERSKQFWIEIDAINRDLIYSIVYSEDGSFFEHEGIDQDAILRSLAQNYKNKKYAYGGSTITQQVAKNLFLDNSKSIIRKFKEIIIARRLDEKFSKNEILEVYLNIAEFGPDLYGVQSASRYYFKKSAAEINPAEGAYMALMLPSPRKNHYAIYENKNITKGKRKKLRRILSTFFYEGFISQKQLQSYLNYKYF